MLFPFSLSASLAVFFFLFLPFNILNCSYACLSHPLMPHHPTSLLFVTYPLCIL